MDNFLTERGLIVKDVRGDGNCLFRAISVNLYGSEEQHAYIRKTVADYLEGHSDQIECTEFTNQDDSLSLSDHIIKLSQDGYWAGEDAILAVANVYHCTVQVFNSISEPREYKPKDSVILHNPITIAFYQPGHYKAVSAGNQPSLRPSENSNAPTQTTV